MEQNEMIEKIIKEVMSSLGSDDSVTKSNTKCTAKVDAKSAYPLSEKKPELVKTPTSKTLDDITLKGVLDGSITAEDVRISPETLELQAQISESVGKDAFAKNLRRASELISIPDDRILEIYNALRPYRSTKEELLNIADELENKYNAKINSAFVREAAKVYEDRDRLKKD